MGTIATYGAGGSSFGTSITSSVGSGQDAIKITPGARLHFSMTGTNDYMYSDGISTIFTPGVISSNGLYAVYIQPPNSTQAMYVQGLMSDASNAVAVAISPALTYANATAKLLSVQNNFVEKVAFDLNGKIIPQFTDSSGTPGSATANTTAGLAAIAAASSSAITITNSTVRAASIVMATVHSADATCKSVQVVVSAGSFTLTPNAATTAITKVAWFVIN